jgi:membrane-bound serine protease (ClpP class)
VVVVVVHRSAPARHQHRHLHLVRARADTGAIPSEYVTLPQTRLAIGQRVSSTAAQEALQESLIGQSGVTISQLYPGGKARFGERTLDVLTEGELVEQGRRVRIIGHTGADAVVKEAD